MKLAKSSAWALCPGAMVLGLVGCAASQVEGPAEEELSSTEIVQSLAEQAKASGLDEVYDVLRDGEVSKREYDAAFSAMKSCLEDVGISVLDGGINRADGISHIYSIEPNGLAEDVFLEEQQNCLDSHFQLVDAAYTATTPKVMDEPLRVAVLECMEKNGYETDGTEKNFSDIAVSADADGGKRVKTAAACVGEEGQRLYPDEAGVMVSM